MAWDFTESESLLVAFEQEFQGVSPYRPLFIESEKPLAALVASSPPITFPFVCKMPLCIV